LHSLSHFSRLKPPSQQLQFVFRTKTSHSSMPHRFRQSCDILHDRSNNKENCNVCSCILLAHRPKDSLAIRRDLSALMLRHGAPKHTAGCAAVCISSTTLETDPNKFLNYR
jgi:hypothetical protein